MTWVSDGTGELSLDWVDRRHDVPEGLYQGAAIAVRGVPYVLSSRGRIIKRIAYGMIDPDLEVVKDPSRPVPIPGIDAPLAFYPDTDALPSWRISRAIVRTLRAMDSLPDVAN